MDLVQVLRDNPDSVFVGPEFTAVYMPPEKKALFIPGNYTRWSEEQINQLIVEKVCEYRARLN